MEMNMAKDFQTMVDFIYRPAGHWTGYLHNNCNTCPQKLFEQLELDERYQVLDFCHDTKEHGFCSHCGKQLQGAP